MIAYVTHPDGRKLFVECSEVQNRPGEGAKLLGRKAGSGILVPNGQVFVFDKGRELGRFTANDATEEPVDPEHAAYEKWKAEGVTDDVKDDEETDLPAPTQTVAEAATTLAKQQTGIDRTPSPYWPAYTVTQDDVDRVAKSFAAAKQP